MGALAVPLIEGIAARVLTALGVGAVPTPQQTQE